MSKRISLKDIARKVGVSTALVSYVLNNKKLDRISKEVAQKINDTARELNYSINHIARSLKTNKTYTIGLIVADISNPFSSTLARIIEDEAEKNNYTVIFGSSDEDAEKSLKLMNILLNHRVDGLIIAPAENSAPQITYLQEREIPFVLIDRYFPDLKTNYVAIDNYKAAHLITRYMVDQNYQRVAFITSGKGLFNLQERKRGYLAGMEESQLPVNDLWIKEVSNKNIRQEVEDAIDQLLGSPQPPDSILFASNTLSSYGLKYINKLPVKVPDDIAIASFDESDAVQLFYSPVTYIKQPLIQMGQLATQLLLECIGDIRKIRQVNLDAELIRGV
jgi:LacI family transcriptional regulator